MKSVPFTLTLEFVPYRGSQRNPVRFPSTTGSSVPRGRRGSRFDAIHDMGRIAIAVYTSLNAVDELVIPYPGGSVQSLSSKFTNIALATGIVPQIGNSPSRLMVEGFVNFIDQENLSPPTDFDGTVMLQPNPVTKVFHGNEVLEGYIGPQPWVGPAGLPVSTVEMEVQMLKRMIEEAIADITDASGFPPSVFRLLYKNVVWGDRGHHFPL